MKIQIARAADYINAIHVGPALWAHYAVESGRWYMVTDDDLLALCAFIDSDETRRDAYSLWCARGSGQEMPDGWEPEGY